MIKVRFFASLKDLVGESEIALEVNQRTSARAIFQDLAVRFPDLKKYESVLLIAVNQEYADLDTSVSPGDELALFPPVSGGGS